MPFPKELARENIDKLLPACDWDVQDRKSIKRRALIQMATGSGKTYTAVNFVYRLIKLAGARRVLFLADPANLGDQTLKDWSSSDKTLSEGRSEERRVGKECRDRWTTTER